MNSVKVVTGALHRVRRGRKKAFAAKPKPTEPAPAPQRPAAAAVALAFAHLAQRAIDRSQIEDRAEIARRIGVSRARLTQILDLALQPRDEQEAILFLVGRAGEHQFRRKAVPSAT